MNTAHLRVNLIAVAAALALLPPQLQAQAHSTSTVAEPEALPVVRVKAAAEQGGANAPPCSATARAAPARPPRPTRRSTSWRSRSA